MQSDREDVVAKREQQRQYYADRAENYESAVPGGRTSRCHYNKIVHLCHAMRLENRHRVLEVGVGTGVQATWLQKMRDIDFVGVDLSPEMIEVARQRLSASAQLGVCAAEELPFDSSSFDAVYCCATLHHVADKAKAVSEMARVVKPGGRVAFSEPNILNPLNIRQWMFIPEEKGQLEIRMRNIRRWFEAANLRLLDFGYLNFTPPKPQQLARLFDQIDRFGRKIPLFRWIGSVIVFTGQRI